MAIYIENRWKKFRFRCFYQILWPRQCELAIPSDLLDHTNLFKLDTHTHSPRSILDLLEKNIRIIIQTHMSNYHEKRRCTHLFQEKNENWKIHTQKSILYFAQKEKIKDIRHIWYKIWFSWFAFLISSIVVVWLVVLKTQQGRRKKGWHMESWGASSRQPPPPLPPFFRRGFWTFPKPFDLGAYYFGAIAFPQNAPYFYRRGFFLLSPSHFTIGWKYDTWSNLASGV